jgi:hydroxymethylpyrimidine/phosphomethylpyrimidine kinase
MLDKSLSRKSARKIRPSVLTIAGSDSGGGAGIQADLKTFAAIGVHGLSAITCVTAQSPKGVKSVQAIRPQVVRDQLEAVLEAFVPAAAKTGMLYSEGIIHAVAESLANRKITLIVDPVMIATSGAPLLKPHAVNALKSMLLPLATLLTPNLDEAAFLLGRKIRSPEELRAAARELHARYGCATLVKGGHLSGFSDAIDFYCDGRTEFLLKAARIRGVSTHGTGCTYSAAIAAYCAQGKTVFDAVVVAKEFITGTIEGGYRAGSRGRHFVLNSLWRSDRVRV